jgi:hypothetical protein
MIMLEESKMKRAIEKARVVKPLVKYIAFRHYTVTNKQNGATYNVRFDKVNKKPFASCDCPCGEAEKFICYHIAASVPNHLLTAAERANLNF